MHERARSLGLVGTYNLHDRSFPRSLTEKQNFTSLAAFRSASIRGLCVTAYVDHSISCIVNNYARII